MSARTVIEHALRVYYADSRDPQGLVDKLLGQNDVTVRADALDAAAEVAVRAARGCGESETGQYAASVAAGIAKELRGMAEETAARSYEKDTRGGSPLQGESTHRHARPCEFPEVLCSCPRPRGMSDESINRARRLARVAEFFRSAGAARTRTWSAAS